VPEVKGHGTPSNKNTPVPCSTSIRRLYLSIVFSLIVSGFVSKTKQEIESSLDTQESGILQMLLSFIAAPCFDVKTSISPKKAYDKLFITFLYVSME
jgi:hypothetical protein